MELASHFCYITIILTIFTTPTSTYPKSPNENKLSLSQDDQANSYPVKRRAANPQPPTYVPDSEFDSDGNEPSTRYRRIDNDRKSQASLEKVLDLKRTSLMNHLGKRADRLYKRDLRPARREEAYGIVYGNGRPIGILEPFPQTYELAPMYGSREGIEEIEPLPQMNPRATMEMLYADRLPPNSRNDWEDSANNIQDPGKFANEKYPAVMNDYKMPNRLNNNGMPYKHDNNEKLTNNPVPTAKRDAMLTENQKKPEAEFVADNLDEPNKVTEVKRSATGITNERIDKLKFELNRMQNPGPSDKVEEIEDTLRDILSDMGLIEGEYSGVDNFKNKRDNEAKREADKEDENLEEGVNKIELIKSTHEVPLADRTKREEKKETPAKEVEKAKTEEGPELSYNKDQKIESNKIESAINENPSQLKSETKRSDSKINVANYQTEGEAYIRSKRQETNDIVKGLEKSGDLTVSGNKSPLACSDNDAEMEKRRNKDQTTAGPTSDKSKREHDEYQYQKEIEQNIQAKIDAIKDQVKREIEALKTKASQENLRKKRDVNTLLAEESSALDPQKHPDEKLIPHIRRRRNLEELQILTRQKRGLPDYSNLKNIDSSDYLDLRGEKSRNQRETVQDYEVDPQENKFLPESLPNEFDDPSKKKRSIQTQGLENTYSSEALPNYIDEPSDKKRSLENPDGMENKYLPEYLPNNIVEPLDTKRSLENSDSVENKYIPEASPHYVEETIDKKRSSKDEEGLPAVETPNLNVNQDDTNLQNDITNIRERSVDNSAPLVQTLEKKSASPESVDKDIQQSVGVQQGEDKSSETIKNEDQLAAEIAPESKSNEDSALKKRNEENKKNSGANTAEIMAEAKSKHDPLVKKRSPNTKENSDVAVNSQDKPQIHDKKRDVDEIDPKIQGKKSKREATAVEPEDPVSSKLAKRPTLVEKKEKKRSIENSPLNLKPALQPEVQDSAESINSRRTRRQIEQEVMKNPSMVYGRRKRANAVMPYAKSSFFPYRAEEEAVEDEGDEFDEDSFEDRSAVQKRETGYNYRQNNQYRRSADYQPDYAAPEDYSNNYQPEQKRSLASRYVANENADVYENPNNYLYHPVSYVRQKRQNFDQLASLHGGGPMLHHLASIKERSMQQFNDDNNRNKRNFRTGQNSDNDQDINKEEPENIADLSANDLFGALPQSYDGSNLQRFKRIKRDATLPNSTEKKSKHNSEE